MMIIMLSRVCWSQVNYALSNSYVNLDITMFISSTTNFRPQFCDNYSRGDSRKDPSKQNDHGNNIVINTFIATASGRSIMMTAIESALRKGKIRNLIPHVAYDNGNDGRIRLIRIISDLHNGNFDHR